MRLFKVSSIATLTLFALTPVLGTAAERVGDFSLLDHNGYNHSMNRYSDRAAIAFLVQSNDSSATEAAIPAFKQLQSDFQEQSVEFMMINPMGRLNRDAVQVKAEEYGVDTPILMDDARVISEAMGIERAGEVLIYDPVDYTVTYRGSVEGAEIALKETLAEGAISNPVIATSGEAISFPDQAVPSYVADIAPVLAEQCAECHRAGGVAPFAMDSHTMVQGWSPMIREVLMTRRMPPGQIDGHIGEFINDRLVDDQDVRNIIAWADAGAPKDGTVDPLANLTWAETKWAHGEPDLVLDIPATTVPATGDGVFVDVEVHFDMPQDRYVRGSQIIAGERSVLHHTVNRLDFPEDRRRGGIGFGESDPIKAEVAPYIPGFVADLNPENTGGLIKAGSVLHLNMHYTPNGKETVDRSQVGVWFYPLDEEPEFNMTSNCACVFPDQWTTIPPHDPAFEQTQTITITKDAHIYEFTPHMHFRGKYMRFYADYPDGTQEELINVSNYNYNWQLAYTYKEPKFVPGGTVITAVAAWDNSAQNPANPNPDRAVNWGNESWDEMFFGRVVWKHDGP